MMKPILLFSGSAIVTLLLMQSDPNGSWRKGLQEPKKCSDPIPQDSVPYQCKSGRWVLDTEMLEWVAQDEKRKSELWWALLTRALTDAEMAQVRSYGSQLLVHNYETFNQKYIDARFDAALAEQAKLQMLAKRRAAAPDAR